jgi:hypothetical protein
MFNKETDGLESFKPKEMIMTMHAKPLRRINLASSAGQRRALLTGDLLRKFGLGLNWQAAGLSIRYRRAQS